MQTKKRLKEKVKEKKAELKTAFKNFTKQEEVNQYLKELKQEKIDKLEKAKAAHLKPLKLILDLSYETEMDKKEINSLSLQICICAGWMKRIDEPISINLVNLRENYEENLIKMGLKKWPIRTFKEDILEIEEFQKRSEDLIYLSPDAEEELERIEENKIYIIGGMVDRTIRKFSSLKRANQLKIKAARLPIKQFMGLTRRKPLNIDTVVLLVAEMVNKTDWEAGFLKVCPKRLLLEKEGEKEEEEKKTEK